MIYRVTIAFDVEAENDKEALEFAARASVSLNDEVIGADVVTIEDENFDEV